VLYCTSGFLKKGGRVPSTFPILLPVVQLV
jgi:hypothetical protein